MNNVVCDQTNQYAYPEMQPVKPQRPRTKTSTNNLQDKESEQTMSRHGALSTTRLRCVVWAELGGTRLWGKRAGEVAEAIAPATSMR